MKATNLSTCESVFIRDHLNDFLKRYSLSCSNEGLCNSYSIIEKNCEKKISSFLILSLNRFAKQIHVSRFYPELYKKPCHKYMSATCFYLLVHHFGQSFKLDTDYKIYLESRSSVFHDFYEKLQDFKLTVKKEGLGSGNVDIWGAYKPVDLCINNYCTNRV